jgi:hypothetical protein
MSKLALAAMESDQEAIKLRAQISALQDQIAQLNLELQEAPINRFQARSSIFADANPIAVRQAPEPPAKPPRVASVSRNQPPPVPAVPAPAVPAPEEEVPAQRSEPARGVEPAAPAPVAPVVPAPNTAPKASSAAVDERYAKYVKMQKMLPEGAVRQKMTTDGFSPAEIDSFFANGPPTAGAHAAAAPSTAAPAAVASGEADERYAKYVKMQKMLPEGAVRQKMSVDGFTPAEIDAFIAHGPPTATAASAAPAPAATGTAVPDERYAKYVKMQKMLPEGAVRQKMTTDGFSPAEIDSFFTNGPPMVSGTGSGDASAATVAVAPAPDARYEKYVKMQKMLPEGAVRQKMATDGFSQAEIDAFIANGPPLVGGAPTAPAAAGGAVDERYAKYVKMQKMLPEGAVRQKMTTDGFSAAEIDSFFANGPPAGAAPGGGGRAVPPPPPPPGGASSPSPAPPAPPAVEFGERYAKYTKMKSMLPEGAVRQKMTVDGFTPTEIDAFFGVAPAAGAAPVAPKGPTFTPLEAIRFAKYEKMMKMLPEGAVRQKMVSEEMSPEDIDKFFAVMNAQAAAKAAGGGASGAAAPAVPKPPAVEPPPEGMSAKAKITPKAKMKGVFWTKLKNSEIKGTVWHKLPEYTLPADEVQRLEELFSTKAAPTESAEDKAAKAAAKGDKGGKKLISVLDAQRTQNVLIIMGKVRLGAEQIMHLILDLDPEVLNQELTHTLFEVLPTAEGTYLRG